MKIYNLTEEQIKDLIFKCRTLSSNWKHEFHSLEDEAANQEYEPHFKYDEEELLAELQ